MWAGSKADAKYALRMLDIDPVILHIKMCS